jgi:hypothetical protein
MEELTSRVTIPLDEYKELIEAKKEMEKYRDKYWDLDAQIKRIKELLV